VSYTAKQFEAALIETMRLIRADIREEWATCDDRERRESLWHESKAIERIEEKVTHEFCNIIGRAAGTVATGGSGE
jgi:hypothetical protein